MARKKVRAVRFLVKPELVADDGENLEVLDVEPMVVAGADWPTYAQERWPELVKKLEAEINAAPARIPRAKRSAA